MRRGVRALAAMLVAGCAARTRPAPIAPDVRALTAELDSTFANPTFARSLWGVVVLSLDNGEVLYRRNADILFKPASNQKIVTGAAALATMGADFRWRTPVLALGRRSADTLAGDLVVVGRGDPTLSQRVIRGPDLLGALRPWADSLRARGVGVVTGRVRGDASYFPDPIFGEGWMWDDLPFYYNAPIGALQFNEGVAVLEVAPGDSAGMPARVSLTPREAPLRLFSAVTTVAAGTSARWDWTRPLATDSVPVTGTIALGATPTSVGVAVLDPTRYFEAALTQVLREAGIVVLGMRTPANVGSDTLFVWQSPPLRDVLPHFQKPSQNQIGEALLRTMGGVSRGMASVDSGRAAVRDFLTRLGVTEDAWRMADGSGSSHYDYVTPDLLARTLVAMARRADADVFINSLPVAGVDGTLSGRMRGTAAQGNARAKTGEIAGSRCLSGYVTTRDGERLVFVLLANHFTFSPRVVEQAQDHVVERLANFSRRTR